MKTVFDLVDELRLTRDHYPDAFGISCISDSRPTMRHYFVMRTEAEFDSYKDMLKDFDFKFYVLPY